MLMPGHHEHELKEKSKFERGSFLEIISRSMNQILRYYWGKGVGHAENVTGGWMSKAELLRLLCRVKAEPDFCLTYTDIESGKEQPLGGFIMRLKKKKTPMPSMKDINLCIADQPLRFLVDPDDPDLVKSSREVDGQGVVATVPLLAFHGCRNKRNIEDIMRSGLKTGRQLYNGEKGKDFIYMSTMPGGTIRGGLICIAIGRYVRGLGVLYGEANGNEIRMVPGGINGNRFLVTKGAIAPEFLYDLSDLDPEALSERIKALEAAELAAYEASEDAIVFRELSALFEAGSMDFSQALY